MRTSELALVSGMADTRATLARWTARPGPVLGRWAAGSAAITAALLGAVWLISLTATPDPTVFALPGVHTRATIGEVGDVLARNALVLALHAMACVAGFIAGSSLPLQAAHQRGAWRAVHEHAGRLAIGFVVLATTFSLVTQALALGHNAATLAHQLQISRGLLIVGLLPHALPELVALFLPLAAWMAASRRGDWHELLAATFATVAVAVPVLVAAAFVETFATGHLLAALAG